jgi:hypothetical protein
MVRKDLNVTSDAELKKKKLISHFSFYWAFEVLRQPAPKLTDYLFYWVVASATNRSSIAFVQSLINTPGSLTNENLRFVFLTN